MEIETLTIHEDSKIARYCTQMDVTSHWPGDFIFNLDRKESPPKTHPPG
jgi:hypothetical protein